MITNEEEIYDKRWFILFSIGMSTFMCALDSSIVNVALPVIGESLKVSMSTIQWVVTTYLLVILGLLLTFGRLGDLKGKTKIFRVGIIIFTIGSLVCGIANNITLLIIGRAIQGLGAACTTANSQGIITSIFPSNERGKALGIIALIIAVGTMIGPALGGIISSFKWEFIFLINIPIGIITSILSFKVIPDVNIEIDKKVKLDLVGALLFILTIVPLTISITEGSVYGFTNNKIIFGLILSLVSFILFIASQKRIKAPLLDLNILKNQQFSKGIISVLIAFMTISSYTIILPFYYESVRGLTTVHSGILMIVFPVALTLTGPLSGSLSDKIRKEILPLTGFIVCAIGFGLLSTIKINTSLYLIVLYIFIVGVGTGLFQSPMNSIVMSSVNKDKLGVAGSLNALVRSLGMIFGITFSTSLLYTFMSNKLGFEVNGFVPGHPQIFVTSMDIIFIIATILSVLGAIVVFSILISNNKK